MKKQFLLAVAAVALLPALAAAQGACVNVAGKAGISPGLEAIPVLSGTFTFAGTSTSNTCAGQDVWAGISSKGTLTAPSCNGNVHQGTTNGGAQFQGVCVGNTCDGAAVMGHAMSYQLVFDQATVQNALDKCDPEAVAKDKDGGLTSASFIGAYESQAKN